MKKINWYILLLCMLTSSNVFAISTPKNAPLYLQEQDNQSRYDADIFLQNLHNDISANASSELYENIMRFPNRVSAKTSAWQILIDMYLEEGYNINCYPSEYTKGIIHHAFGFTNYSNMATYLLDKKIKINFFKKDPLANPYYNTNYRNQYLETSPFFTCIYNEYLQGLSVILENSQYSITIKKDVNYAIKMIARRIASLIYRKEISLDKKDKKESKRLTRLICINEKMLKLINEFSKPQSSKL